MIPRIVTVDLYDNGQLVSSIRCGRNTAVWLMDKLRRNREAGKSVRYGLLRY